MPAVGPYYEHHSSRTGTLCVDMWQPVPSSLNQFQLFNTCPQTHLSAKYNSLQGHPTNIEWPHICTVWPDLGGRGCLRFYCSCSTLWALDLLPSRKGLYLSGNTHSLRAKGPSFRPWKLWGTTGYSGEFLPDGPMVWLVLDCFVGSLLISVVNQSLKAPPELSLN